MYRYFQGEITGLGFKWAQSRQVNSLHTYLHTYIHTYMHTSIQVISPLPDHHPGMMTWSPADGGSGYEATYHVLASTGM